MLLLFIHFLKHLLALLLVHEIDYFHAIEPFLFFLLQLLILLLLVKGERSLIVVLHLCNIPLILFLGFLQEKPLVLEFLLKDLLLHVLVLLNVCLLYVFPERTYQFHQILLDFLLFQVLLPLLLFHLLGKVVF